MKTQNIGDFPAQQKALSLFQRMYRACPGYRKFVDSHQIDVSEIKTISDFEKIPICDRQTYLNRYPLHERIDAQAHISDFYLITTSSGSTGKPTFWLRDHRIDDSLIVPKEAFYKTFFSIQEKRTLVVVTFVLGMWIGGILETFLAFEASRKHRLSVVTPGMNVKNALTAIAELSAYYDQTIILGYPPFITDLVEAIREASLPLRQMHLKFVLTGDRFTEHWRATLRRIIGSARRGFDIVGMYACSDTGIVGVETPFSISLLEKIQGNSSLIKKFFASVETPTLVTFNPMVKYVEIIKNEIVITVDQPIPLVRYNIHDRGGFLSSEQIQELSTLLRFSPTSIDLASDYLYVFGRTDSVLVSAANVYIDDIKYCLRQSILRHKISLDSFKFGLASTRGLRNRLKIVIYVKPGRVIDARERRRFESELPQLLSEVNADFKVVSEGTKTPPFLIVYDEGPKDRFQGTKLRYFL